MSTVAYAQLTNKRDAATPGSSYDASPPGVTSYVDAVAALVPAEVLTLHAVIISTTTTIGPDSTTTISDAGTLFWAFMGLVLFGAALYAAPRLLDHRWDKWDWLRILIPPAAFTAWTMLQRTTAFDAVYPSLPAAPRTVAALFLAAGLGVLVAILAYKADQKPVQ